MIFRPKKPLIWVVLAVILIAIGLIFLVKPKTDNTSMNLILAPSIEYANLSLGGFINTNPKTTEVALFDATSTDPLLMLEITKDIQAKVASYGDKKISLYVPSASSSLHESAKDVIANYPNNNITFYFYEDFPFITEFNKTSIISLQKQLENETNYLLERVDLPIKSSVLRKKENSLTRLKTEASIYTKARCEDGACEVVFRVFRVID